MRGLKTVRRFRRFTLWIWLPTKALVLGINHLASALKLRSTNKRRTLLWRKDNGQNRSCKEGKTKLRTTEQAHRQHSCQPKPNAKESHNEILDNDTLAV
jgi:hypothetical protein